MRYALVLTAAALFAPSLFAADAPPRVLPARAAAPAGAADPAITFQTHPLDRVLDDLRAAADLVGGEKAVKAVNKAIKDKLGDKGFDGLDISRPVVGYVLLDPKPENVVSVVAFPITGEKEFLAFCDRWNGGEKAKDLGKGLYEVPPIDRRYKARMRFSDQYAYIAAGISPESALDEKALVPAQKLYDPAERGTIAGKIHFDRLTPAVKLALPALLTTLKDTFLQIPGAGAQEKLILGPVEQAIEKIAARYLLMIGGADTAALRLNVDVPTSDIVVELTLTPKANSALAKEIADRKPTGNRFAGLLNADTAIGFKTRLPFFNDELRAAGVKMLEEGQKQAGNPFGPNGKDFVDELFKGLIRTVKTGEADIVAAVRGPDKDGNFSLVGAIAFEDPAALEKEFKKLIENEAGGLGEFKWDADKVGMVNIHTFKFPNLGFLNPSKPFGGEKALLAFAFAPKGVFVALGPDAIATLKDALAVKPTESPVLDVVVNPARMAKFAEKIEPTAGLEVEKVLGKEDKPVSMASLRVTGGKELNVRFGLNLRGLPRVFVSEFESEKAPADPLEKK
jgi:hypothetical protein